MGKITIIKNNWIKIEDELINLNSFSNISKGEFGMFEDDDLRYFIKVTELNKNEDGSYNNYTLTTYKENEKALWEEDFDKIITSIQS